MYIIKKYTNRKLYDAQKSKYVNLKDLEALFESLTDIKVIDENGDDITGKLMLSVIANKKENAEDIAALSQILRKANGLLGNLYVPDIREPFDT